MPKSFTVSRGRPRLLKTSHIQKICLRVNYFIRHQFIYCIFINYLFIFIFILELPHLTHEQLHIQPPQVDSRFKGNQNTLLTKKKTGDVNYNEKEEKLIIRFFTDEADAESSKVSSRAHLNRSSELKPVSRSRSIARTPAFSDYTSMNQQHQLQQRERDRSKVKMLSAKPVENLKQSTINGSEEVNLNEMTSSRNYSDVELDKQLLDDSSSLNYYSTLNHDKQYELPKLVETNKQDDNDQSVKRSILVNTPTENEKYFYPSKSLPPVTYKPSPLRKRNNFYFNAFICMYII